jgi:hypothetical protein
VEGFHPASRSQRPRGLPNDYDMMLAQELVQGIDLWINTPRRPVGGLRDEWDEGSRQWRPESYPSWTAGGLRLIPPKSDGPSVTAKSMETIQHGMH